MQASSRVREIVRKLYASFAAKDRRAVEQLLSDDFTFTSPRDDHIDKAQYFEKCWPNSDKIRAFQIEKLFATEDEAFVRYSAERAADGSKFRNTEYLRVEHGKIKEVDVYFGRDLDR